MKIAKSLDDKAFILKTKCYLLKSKNFLPVEKVAAVSMENRRANKGSQARCIQCKHMWGHSWRR